MRRYLKTVTDLGWVIIAADAENGQPTNDHIGVRWALITAGLDAMHAAWPASRKWDYVAGGFSGGAKYSAYIGALLLKDGYRLRGMYMGGCNEDRATMAVAAVRPPSSYKQTRIYLSNGTTDTISTTNRATLVAQWMRKSGFKNVRLEFYEGTHVPNMPQVEEALNWFME